MVYGDGVAQRYGGASGVKAACQLAVQLANNAFTRSRANVRLRLVHVSAVNYRAGANLETDLRNLTSRDRGLVQHVRYLRNTHKADLVSMVVGRGGGGVGWLLNRASGSPKHGISIIGLASLRGYTLAHEVGHNLGCQHARDDQFTEGGSTSGNGYGFRFHASNSSGVAAQFRTVMAYAPGRRIAHFSNPAVRYQGTPTGANNANNVRQLNRSLGVVSAYR